MTTIALEVDLAMDQAWDLVEIAEGTTADLVDPTADPNRVWCDFSGGPAHPHRRLLRALRRPGPRRPLRHRGGPRMR